MTTIQNFLVNWQQAHSSLEPDVAWLGAAGWTIPLWADPRIVHRLRQARGSLDSAFTRHYTSRKSANLRALWQTLLRSHGLRRWRFLLSESIDSYVDKRYAVVIPALLLIIEGCIAHAGRALKQDSKPSAAATRQIRITPPGMRRLIWVSTDAFVQYLFRRAPFYKGPPAILNRHWVLHGRYRKYWARRLECIRLFHALGTLVVAVDRPR